MADKENGDWLVMSATEPGSKRSFDTNAVGLTEGQADAEAIRRNQIEKDAGNSKTMWFKCEDPMAVMKRMGFDTAMLEGLRTSSRGQ